MCINSKKIIILQGIQKSGKTQALKKLIHRLSLVGNIVASEYKFKSSMNTQKWDTWAIFEYQNRYIAITSRGDAECFIEKDFEDMEAEASIRGFTIDTYICATHTYGKTVAYVENKAQSINASLHIYKKATYTCSSNPNQATLQNQINDWQADIIFSNL